MKQHPPRKKPRRCPNRGQVWPLRLVLRRYVNAHQKHVEDLECGHTIAQKRDDLGRLTEAKRRRCYKCQSEIPKKDRPRVKQPPQPPKNPEKRITLRWYKTWCGQGPWKRTPVWAWRRSHKWYDGFIVRILWLSITIVTRYRTTPRPKR